MPNGIDNARIADLLIEPRETLDVEIKNWLDLQNSNEDQANLAKAILALANHGGGFLLIGLQEDGAHIRPVDDRPATLNAYTQDLINGIVHRYADPIFHCAVHHVAGPDGNIYPVVAVPGGHRTPVRARRGGPGNAAVQMNAIYIRRPGPRSETPQNAQDWDELLGRCLSARRDELLDRIRDIVTGGVPRGATPEEPDRLAAWTDRCLARWQALIDQLPADDPRRCLHGLHWFAYQLQGDKRRVALAEFPDMLRRSVVRHTGWPPFWLPSRAGIEPYPIDGTVECWLGRDNQQGRDAAHSDFWRVSPDGFAFLLRGYQEDGSDAQRGQAIAPATVFDVTLPVWRVGEVLLHAERLASNLIEGPATVAFRVHYAGLRGRSLASLSRTRELWGDRIAHQDDITLDIVVQADMIAPNLPEIVRPLLEPMYALFSFFELPADLVVEELTRMRGNRF